MSLDNIDLQITRLLARNCRTHYRDISTTVGISVSSTKERINRLVSIGVISMTLDLEEFEVLVNPVIFGYEKLSLLHNE
jgi:DNA-binding Lrp family transcriptional regulator